MFCEKCGVKISDDAKVCYSCGEKVKIFEGNSITEKSESGEVSQQSGNVMTEKMKCVRTLILVFVPLILFIVIAVIINNISKTTLSGSYGYGQTSTGYCTYKIDFNRNGSCLWEQSGTLFTGEYRYNGNDTFIITIGGKGIYSDTTFKAERNGNSLIISGGIFSKAEFKRTEIKVGNTIYFGSYEQDNNLDNGNEPISWRILSVDYGRALLLSEYVLEAKPYNETQEAVTWENCTLRAWLNDEFYNTAFDYEQKKSIVGNVSILSEKGAIQYLNADSGNNPFVGDSVDIKVTEYMKIYNRFSQFSFISLDQPVCWLSTPVSDEKSPQGNVYAYWSGMLETYPADTTRGVCPVIQIDLDYFE